MNGYFTVASQYAQRSVCGFSLKSSFNRMDCNAFKS
jgi:hypothetical protein